ncbi:MAG: hypothetical protein H0V07_03280, partial [Propionibacteriales bacterium]|nr:hypothetical protein [Propionibacteriales bacterium]
MTVQTTYPGVYVVERPSGVHTISAVSTSVTAFVGGAGYGPTNRPVRVTSVAEYERTFGPPVTSAEPMGYQVRHYFMNGGSEAVIVRVAGVGAALATVTLQNAVPANTLILAAASEGTWANVVGAAGLKAEVTASTTNPGDLFNLTLT